MASIPVAHPGAQCAPGQPLADYDYLELAQTKLADARYQLTTKKNAIQSLQGEISQLETLEQQYSMQVETASKQVNSKCAISKLFDEILLSVFLRLVQDFNLNYPWRLQRVSRKWRKVCLDNPRLWSYFDLSSAHQDCDEESSYDVKEVTHTLLQLDRSKGVSLFVRMDTICDCPIQVSKLRALFEHTSRWETAIFGEIECSTTAPVSGIQFLRDILPPNSRFASLRELDWEEFGDDIDGRELPVSIFGTLPKLDTLTLGFVPRLKADAQLPWTLLTSLSITDSFGEIYNILAVLAQCQHLISLKLTTYCREEPAALNPSLDMVTLHHLTEADLAEWVNSDIMTQVLPGLRLPSLRVLSISTKHSLRPVVDLIQRSSCEHSLLEMKLSTPNVQEKWEDALTLWRSAPNLRVIEHCNQNESILKKNQDIPPEDCYPTRVLHELINAGRSNALCPHLSHLRLSRFKFDPVLVVQMIRSRTHAGWPGTRLKTLTIDYKVPLKRRLQEKCLHYEFFRELLEERSAEWRKELDLVIRSKL